MADAWGASWGGQFTRWIMWGTSDSSPTTFGPPFLDRQTALLTTLGATNLILTAIGHQNTISPDIELGNLVRSSRIDRSLT